MFIVLFCFFLMRVLSFVGKIRIAWEKNRDPHFILQPYYICISSKYWIKFKIIKTKIRIMRSEFWIQLQIKIDSPSVRLGYELLMLPLQNESNRGHVEAFFAWWN